MKNIINNISTFIIFITFIFSINSVFAKLSQDTKNPKQKVTANLIFKRGDVLFRTPDTKFESIEVGQDLFEKDILKTESGAVAILVLPDSSKIKVGPSTEIKIEKLVSQIEDESFEESSIILRTGKILIDIINKSAEPVLKIKTKNAAIAVRGTRFFLSQEYSGDGNLWVAADHGELEVTSLRIKGMADAIDPGQGIVIDQLGGFSQPQEYNWVKKINYDTEHRTSEFGEYSSSSTQRENEFKQKRKPWKANPERFNKRKAKWKKLKKRYAKKAQKFSEHRKKFRELKRGFRQKREKYFKKRKKIFYKIQDLKQKLKKVKRENRSKRRELTKAIKSLNKDYQSLEEEKVKYRNSSKESSKDSSKAAPKTNET
ncbi:MAG: hypothetical protein HN576_05865 [Bacteriovoracaceae bacterium]|jgi:hypothetical protein|nr:hypothetical protein [Bacteriovoracaceae bacterium]